MHAYANLLQQREFPNFSPKSFPIVLVPQFQAVPVSWDLTQQYSSAVATVQQEGMTFGTFLDCLATAVGGAVLFDPKASKEAKELAKTALGVSLPFLLTKAFDLKVWPGQSLN